ncbi:hypothetical protein [uncultured Salegentibacter sp.]|uniref:hypothetical protein n=1 Tax=uncultured Salegentibacter sp. TaxID=259320 RepID=UPI0030D77585|tara:strand:+ start:253 stop:774 length:522 start_codon:yes stop_codon:yes gene_type:complete
MKKTFILLLLAVLCSTLAQSQTLSLDFLKKSPNYKKTELIDAINERGFHLVHDDFSVNVCKEKYTRYFFSNAPRGYGATNNIEYLVNRRNQDLVIEINYTAYFDNFENLLSEIDSNFKLEKKFYSSLYNCEVWKYSYNNYNYYLYIDQQFPGDSYPCIVITNFRIDECFFSNT